MLDRVFIVREDIEEVRLLDWVIKETPTKAFINSFKIQGLAQKDDGDWTCWETAIIWQMDFKTGKAVDISGQRYQLMRPSDKYLSEIEKTDKDFYKLLINLPVPE